MMDRRSFLLTASPGLALLTANAAATVAPWTADGVPESTQLAAHALNRLGFGPRPGDLAAVAGDPRGWALAQLNPQALPLPASLTARLDDSFFERMNPIAVLREFAPLVQQQAAANGGANPVAQPPERPQPPQTPLARFVREHQQPANASRLWRALESPRQLEEVMVDFWFNHFNVFQGKNFMRVLVGHYEHHAIRPFALGRFRDLLGAVTHHPAMLYYLDNWQSSARGLNENHARELMELHTLGVDGGYTQQDVTTLARMLTGWTLVPLRPRQALEAPPVQLVPPGRSDTQTGFWFNPRMHDPSEKTWLGRAVAERGQREGEAALDHLARHPATARHIARKLVQYFVADQPPPALVERLAQVFLAEDGQTVPVLRALFTSDAFWAPEHRGSKFKTPYHYALSALRAGDWRPASLQPVVLSLAAQGMPLFGCPTPDGYKNTETAWLNPDGMTKRINLATQLAAGRLLNEPLSPAAGSLDAAALMDQLGPLVTPATRTLAEQARAEPALATALVLAGPGMMRR